MSETRPPVPPFTFETATQKARMTEDAWNARDPVRVSLAYTPDSKWRNRSDFFQGREAIVNFLKEKWAKEMEYRLIKEMWAFEDDKIAARFCYEWKNQQNQWFRSYGNENWHFNENGLMMIRHASINDIEISEEQRLFRWPHGPRPADHPGLPELGI